MKTAMQELIEIYEYYHSFEEFNEWFMDMGKKAMLEKEKEQIIKDWEKGYSTGCVVGGNDYTNEDEQKDNGNYYYNQTYNQNK